MVTGVPALCDSSIVENHVFIRKVEGSTIALSLVV